MNKKIEEFLAEIQVPAEQYEEALNMVYNLRVRVSDEEFMGQMAMAFCLAQTLITEKTSDFVESENGKEL